MNIGIVGGGITGLTAGYMLSRQGNSVTIFEKESSPGGQVRTFEVSGERLERFYHHIFTSDVDIVSLIDELGLGQGLAWLNSKVGFFHGGRIYDFVTPLDLARFSPVGITDRVRLGLVSLYLRRCQNWYRFEDVTAHEWLSKRCGRRNYDVIWGPLLRGKFGETADEIGMVWIWGKLRLRFASRAEGMSQERLGYLRGSFGRLVDVLSERVKASGGTIHLGAPVHRITAEDGKVTGLESGGDADSYHAFDTIVATVPSAAFLAMAPDLPGDYKTKLQKARYQTAVCLGLIMSKPLSPIYWLNISDPSIPFVAVIEHTNLVDPGRYGGKHVVYVSNYVSPDSPIKQLTAADLLATYVPHLKRINPRFDTDWVEDYHVFSDDAGQPIVGKHYSQEIPDHKTPVSGLYLANTAQIYPEDRGMNYSVRLGTKIHQLVSEENGGAR